MVDGPRGDIPIYRFVIAFGRDYLGRQVVGGTAQRPGNIWHLFREAKVGNLQVTMTVKQEILRLQVTIDNLMGVKILQRQCDFCCIEFGNWIGETLQGGRVRM